VQVVLAARPVTVQTAGDASLAFCAVFGTFVPAPQVSVTLTVVVSVSGLSVKFLNTVKVAAFSVLVIVQEALPFGVNVTGAVQPLAA
jgi:hypothetical protein